MLQELMTPDMQLYIHVPEYSNPRGIILHTYNICNLCKDSAKQIPCVLALMSKGEILDVSIDKMYTDRVQL